ncbi:MAG: proliferating cell nuclear antigen (pcna) [Candidatus Micrarchaeota archaeon]|nr:proliferating cell nuclear antigen (pcna) [Candidatus Micrarchaeota archaeon]
MKLVIGDAKAFKQCIEAVVNLVDEGQFEINENGMHLRSMDPSQIAMVDFTLPKAAFNEFDAVEQSTLSLNLVDFLKILSRARADEQLHLTVEEKESKCVLEFISPNAKRNIRIPLMELNVTSPREPKITFDTTIKMRGGTFKEMLKDAGMLSSHVILSAEGDKFLVEAKGDSGDLRIESAKGSPNFAELHNTAKSRAMYPFEYLDNMTKACPDDSMIELFLKSDCPVKISYNVGQAKLSYFLAPRVEN